jgi:hypothetical protein
MLMTAGCSFVWGDELEGFDTNPPSHQKHTFTDILAKKKGMDYVNLGVCGACNDKIFREVTDYLYSPRHETPITHMVVMWSAWQRNELVEYVPEEKSLKIGRQQNVTQFSHMRCDLIQNRLRREILTDWYNLVYTTHTDIMHTLTKQKTLELLCEAKGIRLIQGWFHIRNKDNLMAILTDAPLPDGDLPFDSSIKRIPEWSQWVKDALTDLKPTSKVGWNFGQDLYSLCLDLNDKKEHGHPGEKTQLVFADFLFSTFAKMEQGEL